MPKGRFVQRVECQDNLPCGKSCPISVSDTAFVGGFFNVEHKPPFGHVSVPGEPWGDFLSDMEADDELAALAPLVRQSITGAPTIES